MNESDRLEFALTHLKDWDRFESFANGFLSEMYPNLRPIAGTNDKGRDAVLFESDEPSVVLQYSIVEDWRGKIRNTVTRLSDAGLSFSVLVYATNQSIGPKADELKKELRASGLALDIWDRPQFLSRIYKSRATVAVSQELARRVVDPLLPAEEVVKNSNLTVPELKAGLLYLELQLRDVESNLGLTKLCFQSLVLAALASTGPEATKSRTEIREHVHRQFPSHDRDRLNQLVDGALERLKNRGRVTWTGASDSFALHYNERVELAERARGILAEREIVRQALGKHIRDAVEALEYGGRPQESEAFLDSVLAVFEAFLDHEGNESVSTLMTAGEATATPRVRVYDIVKTTLVPRARSLRGTGGIGALSRNRYGDCNSSVETPFGAPAVSPEDIGGRIR